MTNNNNEQKKITLSGNEAIELYLKGREEWNKWVEENPIADIDFHGMSLSALRTKPNSAIDFSEFTFPKGKVNFIGATFGDGDVSFNEVNFGDGEVNFSHATFGHGEVFFNGATFGDGDVSFSRASFGIGEVYFSHATFGNGNVYFSQATFGKGNVFFSHANFGNGDVRFNSANFGKGGVYFDGLTASGHFSLIYLINSEKIEQIDFKLSSLLGGFELTNNTFNCVIDLTLTDIKNHVHLDGLTCKVINKKKYLIFNQAKDEKDIARLRRLKELAEKHHDHKSAQQFNAQEMRAKRWHETKPFKGLEIDYLFDWLSNYGQSLVRPIFWLMLSWLGFSYYYFINISKDLLNEVTKLDALRFSASNILPFLPSSKGAREKGINLLFGGQDSIPYDIYTIMSAQGLISFILLFLIGLALRNRFRI